MKGSLDLAQSNCSLSPSEQVKEAIIDLYLNVKIRNPDESMESEELEEDKDWLWTHDEITILDYIRSSVEILMNLKIEEHEEEIEEKLKQWIKDIKNSEEEAGDSEEEDAPNNYEKVI